MMEAAHRRQKKKDKKRKKAEKMETLKAYLQEITTQHTFTDLDKDQRGQLHLHALKLGLIPKFRGQGGYDVANLLFTMH